MKSTNNRIYAESITETPSAFDNLDLMTTEELLSNMNNEDSKVHLATGKVIPKIQQLIDQIVDRMKNGGRIFYLGAGTSGRLGVLDASEIPPTFRISDDLVIGLIAGGDLALRKSIEAAEDDPEKAWKELGEFSINTKEQL